MLLFKELLQVDGISFELCFFFMMMGIDFTEGVKKVSWRLHTLFSVESQNYFDMKVKQPGPVTRLLSCTDEKKKNYKGMHLAPIFEVPSVSRHPKTGDWYPAINKPAGVIHWFKYSKDAINVGWVLILDTDMIIRGLILPWELVAALSPNTDTLCHDSLWYCCIATCYLFGNLTLVFCQSLQCWGLLW
ncbi:cleavage polyadenylation factor subunit fip1 [Lathyrus oleraceus]|uniref:Cleavage polyadenylation factor subunit fip1 n=1 Tax=Pisum sativum TaxID=3888 RepID=A0A9D4X6X4_PEA|nr:cleavage polyadenylation factor subunit fip1 [Pisum sativum]